MTERRLAAIMFSDIVGYTALMAESEQKGLHARERHREVLGPLAGQYHGQIVDESGDELVLSFPSALDAVNCALAVQAELRDDPDLKLRVGIHLGDVIFEEGRVYGDGVNVASRVRPLAEPGGICVSEQVYDSVKNQPNVEATSLGPKELKNVVRPIEVFAIGEGTAAVRTPSQPSRGQHRVRTVLAAAGGVILVVAIATWATWPRPLVFVLDQSGLLSVPENPPLPDKPSIVVLPFANMSGDAEQEYFADGITEDLTTDLSRSRSLFVISRNSAFSYKGESPRVEDVGRELGVRYVLEGSVRRAGDRVRITAQLIDATTGFHVWSERYDRALEDVFAVQSEISEEILVAVGVRIDEAERARLQRKPTQDFSAYESVSKGWVHFYRFTRKDNEEARRWAQRALELDPQYAGAVALLASTYQIENGSGWNIDPALLDRASELALRAIELDPRTQHAYNSLAFVSIMRRQPEAAADYARREIEVAPNSPNGHLFLAGAMLQQGRQLDALASFRRGIRLDPRRSLAKSVIYLLTGRPEEAAKIWERRRAANPDDILVRHGLIRYYVSVGRLEEARAIAAEILAVNPDLTAEWLGTRGLSQEDDVPAVIARLRRAGLP